jgi:5-methylcytosine-specific restriction endonuclease McrA
MTAKTKTKTYQKSKKERQIRMFDRLRTIGKRSSNRLASCRLSLRRTLLEKQMFVCAGLTDGCSDHYSDCSSVPTECDHIIEMRWGGLDTRSNLQMLCRDCHLIKTRSNYMFQQIY